MTLRNLFIGVGSAALLTACGGAPLPAANVASAQAAIRAAHEMGAENTPQAALHLKYAEDQYKEAQALIKEDENERAEMILKRAEADAELALTLARETAAQKEARKAVDHLNQVKSGR